MNFLCFLAFRMCYNWLHGMGVGNVRHSQPVSWWHIGKYNFWKIKSKIIHSYICIYWLQNWYSYYLIFLADIHIHRNHTWFRPILFRSYWMGWRSFGKSFSRWPFPIFCSSVNVGWNRRHYCPQNCSIGGN